MSGTPRPEPSAGPAPAPPGRAARQARTRARIVDAVTDLHAQVGPARTTVSAVARRAGVQRVTVYRHFPDEAALHGASGVAWLERSPLPDADAWLAVPEPRQRTRVALAEVYDLYATGGALLERLLRDRDQVPALGPALGVLDAYLTASRELLAHGWGVRGRRRRRLLAALGHALAFATWRSLTAQEGLTDAEAADLMARMVEAC